MDWLARLESPQNALAVLTAMITPAVLISACGALIFSTATRLGRVVDRVRILSEKFETLAKHPEADEMADDRRQLLFAQLDRQTSRARLIQRAMVAFYSALGIFVATSVAIAVIAAVARSFTWIAVALGVLGAPLHALRQRAARDRVAHGHGRHRLRDGLRVEGEHALRGWPAHRGARRAGHLAGKEDRLSTR